MNISISTATVETFGWEMQRNSITVNPNSIHQALKKWLQGLLEAYSLDIFGEKENISRLSLSEKKCLTSTNNLRNNDWN